ncbi:MAG: trypsin-like peptidase domain-containing protein [Eubacteriales bacterium]
MDDEFNSETDSNFKDENKVLNREANKSIGRKYKVILILIIIAASMGSAFIGGLVALNFNQNHNEGSKEQINISTESNINTAQAIAEKAMPSVVGISTEVVAKTIFGQAKMQGVGTGVIVDKNGFILTNSHVINDGDAKSISVHLYDGREMAGTVLWHDATIDLAIVKVDASNLVPAELGDSEKIKVGQYAVAIGNPLGFSFERSITAGIISGINRSIQISDTETIDGLIQTDASINPGNSGGPLFDATGKVVGINAAKIQSGEGLGFAIPINIAKPIVSEVKEKGQFIRAYLGIQGISVEQLQTTYQDRDFGTKQGVFAYQVFPGSPADKAGIMENDIILKIGETKVATMGELIKVLFSYRPGDTVSIALIRGKETMIKDVKLTGSSN